MHLNSEEEYVIETLRNFLSGDGGDWDFDDFFDTTSKSILIRNVSLEIEKIRNEHPGHIKTEYFNEEGVRLVESIICRISYGKFNTI